VPPDQELQAKLLEAAVAYAGRGLPVFPCNGKVPLTEHGFQDASADMETVLAWWTRWPEAAIGIPTGAVSGLFVLDVDVQHGGAGTLAALERKHGVLPPAPEVLTGGGGKHLYFAHPGQPVQNSAGKLGPGLDVRADGGYVIAPPSLHANGRAYRWLRSGRKLELPEPPAWLLEDVRGRRNGGAAPPVEEVIAAGQRRSELLSLAGTLRRRGLDADEILVALAGVNEKRCRPPLPRGELEALAEDVADRYEPAVALGKATYNGPPSALEETVAVFRRHLHLPDPRPLYATLAAVVANRLRDEDAVWFVLVGPSGGGKTELLNALSGLEDVYAVATLTGEAALLSGTPRKDRADGATGGLLPRMGDFGIIVLKDFGSVLSMHRDARGKILAALREIYDGAWSRDIGADGGRSLSWHGKVGLVAGCVPTLDRHYEVMAQLGERFTLYRLSVDEADEHAKRSLAHVGGARAMRSELREAVQAFFVELDPDPAIPPFTAGDRRRLIALAVLTVRARSPVVRDAYKDREIELVPEAEAPGRLVVQLGLLLAALRLIGLDDGTAWSIVSKVAMDSMPTLRRQVLELLVTGKDGLPTPSVAVALDVPTTTCRRVLQDLTAHQVLQRITGDPGAPDSWRATAWTRDQYAAGGLPDVSGHPLYSNTHTVKEENSGTPPPAGEGQGRLAL
jgi:hypothetical protein